MVPPVDKSKDYPPITLYLISAKQGRSGKGQVNWKLLTNMPINSFDTAFEKINWYKQRWNIEVFFKTLKSGFGVERNGLRHISRLKNLNSRSFVLTTLTRS